MSTIDLRVDDEVYVSNEGLEYIKEWHEKLSGYAFTSKVVVISDSKYWGHDDGSDGMIYECKFINDPDQEMIQLTDKELSLTPLYFFNTSVNTIVNTTPMPIEDIMLFNSNGGQVELEIEDGELKVPTTYEEQGQALGKLVDRKQLAYGNAIEQTFNVVEVFMKPYETEDGYTIPKSLLRHLLFMVRIIDKQNRIFNNPNADLMDESPYSDISGYGLLGSNMMNTK